MQPYKTIKVDPATWRRLVRLAGSYGVSMVDAARTLSYAGESDSAWLACAAARALDKRANP